MSSRIPSNPHVGRLFQHNRPNSGLENSRCATRSTPAPVFLSRARPSRAHDSDRQHGDLPGVKLSIRSDYSATAVANIALMEADIGVLYHSVSHPAVKEIELASSRLVCVGHPDVLDEAPFMEISELEGREIIGPDPADPLGRLLAKRLEELSITVRTSVTAQSYHSLVALAARSKVVTIVDEIAALSARAQGLNVVLLAPEIAIPVVASVAINGERSALVEQFMQVCRTTFRTFG
ncbi:LysR substrate-binding domain-containing protein [Paraburkholderia sediminicola]|uniref:LysR substrate-binding domain-containing protein n=1 Tax=Paraburkholderia sediminicola TaxID=458836 RepID=UPI0038B89E29